MHGGRDHTARAAATAQCGCTWGSCKLAGTLLDPVVDLTRQHLRDRQRMKCVCVWLQIEQLQAGRRSLDRVVEAKDLELQAAHTRVKEAMVRN